MTVRFFFDLSISFLIPRNPHNRRDGISDASWEQSCIDEAASTLAEKLNPRGFDVAYRAHHLVDTEHRLHVVHFAVSAARDFDIRRASAPRKGRPLYALRPGEVATTKSRLGAELRDALKGRWVINAITYRYLAAWHFVYEVKMEGVLALRRALGPTDIADAGGSVRDALETFNREVADSLEPLGITAFPHATAKRPKDDIFKFDVYSVQYIAVSEDDVSGDLSLMDGKMSAAEVPYLELKSPNDSFSGEVGDALTRLECHDYPANADLVSVTLELSDVDEDVVDHVDFLAA
ncbi:hypothetical protein [Paraburkholderia sp. SIMBA_054]|uniref:hypothetical protein n=1 Tax=Paraburkholderia sp. SIMBA_054 TaxID=3085795 RepID=UPI00397853C9